MNELPIDMIGGVPMVYVKIWSRNNTHRNEDSLVGDGVQ